MALPLIPIAAVGILGWVGWKLFATDDDNSIREDTMADDDKDLIDESVWSLTSALGWPYSWAEGDPSTPWSEGENGVDCSGFVQMAQVHLGILSSDAPDRSAATIADCCDEVPIGQQRPGDMAYYPGHIMQVVGYPGSDGHSAVMGASGGGSSTHGDDPNAYVKVFSSGKYRSDFVCYMRWKPDAEGVLG